MKPEVAVFTKERPVNKVDLWRCFRRSPTAFAVVQVDDAHSIIGKNAPRYLEKKGYLRRETVRQVDRYVLTKTGEEWLNTGIIAYAKNHPAERAAIPFFPGANTKVKRITRRR